jgi:hypothetical protein
MREKVQIGHKVDLDRADKFSVLKQALSQPDFHRAYLSSARRLFSDFESKDSVRSEDALPIFFLQRHALELLIKDCLRIVYQLMFVQHELDAQRELPSGGARKRICEHDILKLYKDFKIGLCFDDDASSAVIRRLEALVSTIHDIDEKSTWARYPDVDKETCVTGYIRPQELDLEFYQQEIEALSVLLWGSDFDFYDAMMWKYHEAWNVCMGELNDV